MDEKRDRRLGSVAERANKPLEYFCWNGPGWELAASASKSHASARRRTTGKGSSISLAARNVKKIISAADNSAQTKQLRINIRTLAISGNARGDALARCIGKNRNELRESRRIERVRPRSLANRAAHGNKIGA